jgi:hypothetical protein
MSWSIKASRKPCTSSLDCLWGKERRRRIGGRTHRERAVRHRGATRPPVVEGGQSVAVPESVELELPRLDRVPQAADQQDVRPVADLLGPYIELPDAYVLAHR